ncbi:ArsR family transcriptional regulator [Patescibacteria group bacterium]|nr:MAG: ArsR family transcriptional regulator [Patescibacteria group bacterium]
MKDLEKVYRALGNRRRLRIIQLLIQNKEMSVIELAEALRLSYRATSKHANLLAATAILDKEQRGSYAYYRIADEPTQPVASALKHIR